MAMKSYKPTTSSLRFRTGLTFQELTAEKPLKRLTKGKTGTGGRGAGGRVSSSGDAVALASGRSSPAA